jgi:hypothetical protein
MLGASSAPLDSADIVYESKLAARADDSLQKAHSYQIHMRSAAARLVQTDLVSILEKLLPVRFTISDERFVTGAPEIIVESWGESPERSCNSSNPSLTVPQNKASPDEGKLTDILVHFVDDPSVPFPYRGRSLRSKIAVEAKVLSLRDNEKALATTEQGPVWTVSQESVPHFRSGFALPRLPVNGCLTEVLNGERFLETLPVLHWLRETCSERAYHGPPPRACFIFDDPNLHWRRYGFVDFRQIAVHAATLNYHVAFATIPLDSWFTHKATAEVFKQSRNRLSLIVHGNNHTWKELARNYSARARECLLAQTIQRVERIERKAGIRVCRVMVPPHGACSEDMLAALPRYGFEAACISHGSLRSHNQTSQWTRSLGYLPSELIQGCPVLPRWGLSGSPTNTILLAAFLRQPIILRGHHTDLKDGIEQLDQIAAFINGLGRVAWSSMTDLSRMNYLSRLDGNTFRAQPLGRKVSIQLPTGATHLIIESPLDCPWDSWRISGAVRIPLKVPTGERISVSRMSSRPVLIEATAPPAPCFECAAKPTAFGAVLRRCLTEGRDRFLAAMWR